MCDFRIDNAEIRDSFGTTPEQLAEMYAGPAGTFGEMVEVTPEAFAIPERARPLTRMIARAFDAYDLSKAGHSPAV
jgi:oxygen-independent coproporphyrinogen-3 oxidase